MGGFYYTQGIYSRKQRKLIIVSDNEPKLCLCNGKQSRPDQTAHNTIHFQQLAFGLYFSQEQYNPSVYSVGIGTCVSV